MSLAEVLVIGIGTPERGADAAGPSAAVRLAAQLPEACDVRCLRSDVIDLVDDWQHLRLLILIDSMASGLPAGCVRRFDASEEPLPAVVGRSSTHDLGVATALELARATGMLPPRVIVFAVEGDSYDPGTGLSPPVREGIEEVVGRVLEEIAQLSPPAGPALAPPVSARHGG